MILIMNSETGNINDESFLEECFQFLSELINITHILYSTCSVSILQFVYNAAQKNSRTILFHA